MASRASIGDLLAGATGPEAAKAAAEPDWNMPRPFDMYEAEQFAREHDVDPALVVRMLADNPGRFAQHKSFLWPTRRQVATPEATCPGMEAAGRDLAAAVQAGETIAVFCDYDPDGITGGETLRLALSPYLTREDQLLMGYADAQRGFGLTDEFVERAHQAGASTLITVDCGSTQTAQINLARAKGMRTIVVDHHAVDLANPADHHLNPKLHEPIPSENTGAQLAWKLGAAVQSAAEENGRSRPEHWKQAMYLAGLGARADMGPVRDLENRAFFWWPLDHADGQDLVPPGLRVLAEALGENPDQPGGLIMTSACMNLPKRSRLVDAADVAALLQAPSREAAQPLAERLLAQYEQARPAAREIERRTLEQVQQEEAARLAERDVHDAAVEKLEKKLRRLEEKHAEPLRRRDDLVLEYIDARNAKDEAELARTKQALDEVDAILQPMREVREELDAATAERDAVHPRRVGYAVIDDMPDYAGYTGTAASRVAKAMERPIIVFANRGEDEMGREVYKFSIRDDDDNPHLLGALLSDEAMQQACMVERTDESGAIVTSPSLGGHPQVVSGGCYRENIEAVAEAVEAWAERCATDRRGGWSRTPYTGPNASIAQRKVEPERFVRLEEESRRLAPFNTQRRRSRCSCAECQRVAHAPVDDRNRPLAVSVMGRLEDVVRDPDTNAPSATLRISADVTRRVVFRADAELPRGDAEWVIRMDGRDEYFVWAWHAPAED